jgi:hypothetical protein
MRYALAVLLALGIGIPTAIPAALAENNPGQGCHKDGVVYSCTRPARLYLGTGSSQDKVPGPTGLVAGEGPVLEIHGAASTHQPLLSPADSGFVTSPPSLGPGYNTGYSTVEQPSQPLWVVQFPL